mmetsp:Transcript_19749/g.54350  ORF Transcript_19749/g.54350 Transcript_19749/m.54350 type:complete len:244 (-) Transcript_19749:151-882(-)
MRQGPWILRYSLSNQLIVILILRWYVLEVETVFFNQPVDEAVIVPQTWIGCQFDWVIQDCTHILQERSVPQSWRCELQRVGVLEDCGRHHDKVCRKRRRGILQRLAMAGHCKQNKAFVCAQLWAHKLQRATTSLHRHQGHLTLSLQTRRGMLQGSAVHRHSAQHDTHISAKRFRGELQCEGVPLHPREDIPLVLVHHGHRDLVLAPAESRIVQAWTGPPATRLPKDFCRETQIVKGSSVDQVV